jgi:plasmid stability protein
MTDLLIRGIAPAMKRRIEQRARAHRRSLSDEAKALLQEALLKPEETRKLGTELFNMIRPEDRGDDLVFEYSGELPRPPEFE